MSTNQRLVQRGGWCGRSGAARHKYPEYNAAGPLSCASDATTSHVLATWKNKLVLIFEYDFNCLLRFHAESTQPILGMGARGDTSTPLSPVLRLMHITPTSTFSQIVLAERPSYRFFFGDTVSWEPRTRLLHGFSVSRKDVG